MFRPPLLGDALLGKCLSQLIHMQRTFTACSQRTRCANCVSGFYAAQEARQRWHCTRPPLWTDGLDSTPKRQERFRSLNGLIDARPTEHKHDDLPVT